MEDNKNPFTEETNEELKEQTAEETAEANSEETKETENEEENIADKIEVKSDIEQKYEDLNNKYIRLAADFDNFRKRTVQEKEELSKYTTIEIMKKITSILDTFDRAQEQLKEIDNCQTVKESYEVAFKQFVETLKKMGLEEIDALGKEFNPNEHEAITQIPTSEFEPDQVALVAQKGYKLMDKIVRPALVGVAIKKEDE